jgi:hypothetical protein
MPAPSAAHSFGEASVVGACDVRVHGQAYVHRDSIPFSVEGGAGTIEVRGGGEGVAGSVGEDQTALSITW